MVKYPAILIVGDTRQAPSVLLRTFEDDQAVFSAQDAESVFDYMTREDIAIVLLAVSDRGSFNTLKAMKEHSDFSHIPVIVFADEHAVDKEAVALELGADDFIAAPYNQEVVKLRVRKALSKAKVSFVPADKSNHSLFADMTGGRESDHVRKREEERLAIVLEEAGMVVLEWDFETREFYTSSHYERYEMSKWDRQTVFERGESLDVVFIEDRDILREFFDKILQRRTFADAILRLKKRDGAYSWSRMTAHTIRDEQGRLVRTVGTISDIGDQVDAEYRHLMQSEMHKMFLEESSLVVVSYDPALDEWGYSSKTGDKRRVEGTIKNFRKDYLLHSDVVDPEDRLLLLESLDAVCNETERITFEARLKNLDNNQMRWRKISLKRLLDDKGHVFSVVGTMRDIEEVKQLEVRAATDQLSGLYNRGQLEKMIKRALENNAGAACAFFLYDVDNFKAVNDSLGHIAGDRLIKRVSELLKMSFRGDDIVGRLGGDEMVVLLCGDCNGQIIATKTQETLAAINGIADEFGWGIPVSASVGISIGSSSYATFDGLYHAADEALYEVKEQDKDGYQIKII